MKSKSKVKKAGAGIKIVPESAAGHKASAVLPAPAVLPPLPPPADAPADIANMKGMMVRCIDEAVGRSVCGQVLEVLSNTDCSGLARAQVPSYKLGKNVSLRFNQIVALTTVSAPKTSNFCT